MNKTMCGSVVVTLTICMHEKMIGMPSFQPYKVPMPFLELQMASLLYLRTMGFLV